MTLAFPYLEEVLEVAVSGLQLTQFSIIDTCLKENAISLTTANIPLRLKVN